MFMAGVLTFSTVLTCDISKVSADSKTTMSIIESNGDLETAYVEWNAYPGATGYNVYVKDASADDSTYTQLDTELIRQYPGYFRADALGLKAGSYVLKIVPVVDGEKEESAALTTDTLTVEAHDRSGFGFVNGTSSGAYNEDGTLKANADVIYVTEETKDTITYETTVDAKGNKETATGLSNIIAMLKGSYSNPVAIRFIGNITDPANLKNGDLYIDAVGSKLASGLTIEGVGEDAVVNGYGLDIKSSSNIEVRNLGVMNCDSKEGDGVSLQQDNDHIWVHNCDFFYGYPGKDKDQKKGDGALDTKRSTYITHSYNHFYDTGKSNLLGMKSESSDECITYHHNWYDHSDSRHPRVRTCTVHIYNNYFDGNAKYGVGATMGASVFVENNYFRNCKYPTLISMQGSDVYDPETGENDYGETPTLSREPGGIIKAYGNTIIGAKRFVPYSSTDSVDFDAVVVENRDDKVDSSITTYLGSNTYNNFDTSDNMYSYTADTPEVAKDKVEKYAGRVNGGDLKWEFDDAVDDTSSDVIPELQDKLINYKSTLVSVGGNSVKEDVPATEEPTVAPATEEPTAAPATEEPTETPATEEPTETPAIVEGKTYVHNFTTDGLNSDFFTIKGALSKTKGTVSYNDLTLTQCLKVETSTSIAFDTASSAVLTMVFNADNNKSIVVDGTTVAIQNGIATVKLEAGSHTITKSTTGNLYYIEVTTEGTEAPTEEPTVAPTEEPTVAPTEEPVVEPTEEPTVAPTQTPDAVTAGNVGVTTNLSTKKDADFKNVVYVAPNGTEDGEGTKESPKDLVSAINNASEGQAILLLGGTYSIDKRVRIAYDNNGTEDAYKVLRAADGEEVVIDGSQQTYGDPSKVDNERGLQVDGSYWYIAGITVTGAADNGMFISGSNNIIERCILRGNRDSGLQISRRVSSLTDMKDWPANNQIINCTSFDNYDPWDGENADGFAAKLSCGNGNVFDGCIAYSNIDDGWDLYAKPGASYGAIGVVTLRNCVSFNNGTLTNGFASTGGDRNGFKLGGSNGKVPTNHIVDNCIAFNNGKHGFTDNGNGGALSITNCSSYNNAKSNYAFDRTNGGIYKNLLSYKDNTQTADKFVGTITNSVIITNKKYYYTGEADVAIANSEKVGTIVEQSADAFKSLVAPSGLSTSIDTECRNEDGTVNMGGLMESASETNKIGYELGTSAASVVTVNAIMN